MLGTRDLVRLSAIHRSPRDLSLRLVYADELDDEGDRLRAEVLRHTVRALEGDPGAGLAVHIDELTALHPGGAEWADLVGARALAALPAHEVSPRWWPLALSTARPCIQLEREAATEPGPVGTSRLFGDPDLPPGFPWPTYRDASSWFGVSSGDVAPDARCRFVGQLSAADLRRSPAGGALPEAGLLSFFAFMEYESLGITEAWVHWFPDARGFVRTPHPALDEANHRLPEHRPRLRHALSHPEDADQHAALASIAEQHKEAWEGLRSFAWSQNGDRFGVFGYLQATTGGNPTPDASWQRLICTPTDLEGIVWNHVAVKVEALGAGRMDPWEVVWADMDG